MIIYKLIDSNSYVIDLHIPNINIDYYTNINILLKYKGESCILFHDNIQCLKNTINSILKNMEEYKLDQRLIDSNIGILQNQYYYNLYNDIKSKEPCFDDTAGFWIGEKYCIFTNNQITTWLYIINDDIVLHITPVYSLISECGQLEFNTFLSEYKDIFKTTVTKENIIDISTIINSLNIYIDK